MEDKAITVLRANLMSSSDQYLWELWETFWAEKAGWWHYRLGTISYGDFAETLFGVMCEKGL